MASFQLRRWRGVRSYALCAAVTVFAVLVYQCGRLSVITRPQHVRDELRTSERRTLRRTASGVFIPFSDLPVELISSVSAQTLYWEDTDVLDPFGTAKRDSLPAGEHPSAERYFGRLLPVTLEIPIVKLTNFDPPFRMFTLNPRSEGYGGASFELHRRGMFEDDIIRRISMHIRNLCRSEAGLFIDVGTNIGFFSMLAASWGCKVIGFEANPMLHGLVRNSAVLNGFDQVTIIPHGAGPMRSKVYVNNRNTCPACSSMTTETDPHAVQIEIVDISSYIHERPLFMKIDIDGYEIGALEGALTMIRKYKLPLGYVEFNPQWWYRGSIAPERGANVLKELSDLGYTFSRIDGSTYPLDEILANINVSKANSLVGDPNIFFSLSSERRVF